MIGNFTLCSLSVPMQDISAVLIGIQAVFTIG